MVTGSGSALRVSMVMRLTSSMPGCAAVTCVTLELTAGGVATADRPVISKPDKSPVNSTTNPSTALPLIWIFSAPMPSSEPMAVFRAAMISAWVSVPSKVTVALSAARALWATCVASAAMAPTALWFNVSVPAIAVGKVSSHWALVRVLLAGTAGTVMP